MYLFTSSVHFLVQNPAMTAVSTLAVTYFVLLCCVLTLHCLFTITASGNNCNDRLRSVKQQEHIWVRCSLLVT